MKSFDQFLAEGKKELPLGKMSLKAFSKDQKAAKETDINKKYKLENQARMIRLTQNKAAK